MSLKTQLIKALGITTYYKSKFYSQDSLIGNRTCPPFDIKELLKEIGIKEKEEDIRLIELVYEHKKCQEWLEEKGIEEKWKNWANENIGKIKEELKNAKIDMDN